MYAENFTQSFHCFLQVLDTRDLKIFGVKDKDGNDLKFTLGEPVLSFGSELEVQLPDDVSDK